MIKAKILFRNGRVCTIYTSSIEDLVKHQTDFWNALASVFENNKEAIKDSGFNLNPIEIGKQKIHFYDFGAEATSFMINWSDVIFASFEDMDKKDAKG